MQNPTTPSTDCNSSDPALIFPSRSGPNDAEYSRGLQRTSQTGALTGPIKRFRPHRSLARFVAAIAPIVLQIAAPIAFAPSVSAQTETRSETIDRFAEFIAEASTRFAVPASSIRAVMRIESRGDQRATSPRGALGLMQLMPNTAAALGYDPHKALENALGGATYLRSLLIRYHGDSALALAAYNAGPAAVDRFHGIPPYEQTVRYITRVLREYQREQQQQGKATHPPERTVHAAASAGQ